MTYLSRLFCDVSTQSRNVPFLPKLVKSAFHSGPAGEADTGNAGEHPDQGIAGRNSSRAMGPGPTNGRRYPRPRVKAPSDRQIPRCLKNAASRPPRTGGEGILASLPPTMKRKPRAYQPLRAEGFPIAGDLDVPATPPVSANQSPSPVLRPEPCAALHIGEAFFRSNFSFQLLRGEADCEPLAP